MAEKKSSESKESAPGAYASYQPERYGVPSEESIKNIANITCHPEFAKLVQEIEGQPEEMRRSYAEKVATVKEFARRGIPIPDGLRVTTRYFEAPGASTTVMDKISSELIGVGPGRFGPGTFAATVCVSIGWIVCVSVGD